MDNTHKGSITRKVDAAITTKYLLMQAGSDDDHIAVGAVDAIPLGVALDTAAAAEDLMPLGLLGSSDHTLPMVASEAIAVGERVLAAAAGKVSNESASSSTYYQVGVALTAADADGDVIEVDPQPATPVVVS